MPAAGTPAPVQPTEPEHVPAQPKPKPKWQTYVVPVLVVLLAAAVVFTLTWNWNSWEGGRVEQVTDDAYVHGDITPLSTKVAGIVRDVTVSDYQQVHKGDLLVALEDDDYQAQLAQASAAVEAAKAAIENNVRQRKLQDARIDRAFAGIDQAHAQITAAQAGIEAAQADVVRTQAERTRQEALLQTHSTTQQKVEQAVADQERLAAQLASRQADLDEAKTALRSSELAAEAERRTKAVLESQDQQLIADLHAKQAALTVAQVNLGYTKIEAPGDGTVGERQVQAGLVGLAWNTGDRLRQQYQMGAGELSRDAAHQCEFSPIESVTEEQFHNMFNINVLGAILTKTITNYYLVVAAVFATAKDRKGKQLFPRQWDLDYISGCPPSSRKSRRHPPRERVFLPCFLRAPARREPGYRLGSDSSLLWPTFRTWKFPRMFFCQAKGLEIVTLPIGC